MVTVIAVVVAIIIIHPLNNYPQQITGFIAERAFEQSFGYISLHRHIGVWESSAGSWSWNSLTISLSHHHCEVLHSSIGVAEPAAVESKVDGRLAN